MVQLKSRCSCKFRTTRIINMLRIDRVVCPPRFRVVLESDRRRAGRRDCDPSRLGAKMLNGLGQYGLQL
jgi:hypothetical protein